MRVLKAAILTLTLVVSLLLTACAGSTPHIGENGNWFVGETDLGISATGPAGPARFFPKL